MMQTPDLRRKQCESQDRRMSQIYPCESVSDDGPPATERIAGRKTAIALRGGAKMFRHAVCHLARTCENYAIGPTS